MVEGQAQTPSPNSKLNRQARLRLRRNHPPRSPRPQRRRRGPPAAGGGHGVRVRVRGGIGREGDPGRLLPGVRGARTLPLGDRAGRRRGRPAIPHRLLV